MLYKKDILKITTFWDVTMYDLVDVYRHFRRMCCPHHVLWRRRQQVSPKCWYSCTRLKDVTFTENNNCNSYHHENLKSHRGALYCLIVTLWRCIGGVEGILPAISIFAPDGNEWSASCSGCFVCGGIHCMGTPLNFWRWGGREEDPSPNCLYKCFIWVVMMTTSMMMYSVSVTSKYATVF